MPLRGRLHVHPASLTAPVPVPPALLPQKKAESCDVTAENGDDVEVRGASHSPPLGARLFLFRLFAALLFKASLTPCESSLQAELACSEAQ